MRGITDRLGIVVLALDAAQSKLKFHFPRPVHGQGIVKIEGLHGNVLDVVRNGNSTLRAEKYLFRMDGPAPTARQLPSMRSPPKISRAAPESSRATPIDKATENHASRRPTVRSMTAKVEMQGT